MDDYWKKSSLISGGSEQSNVTEIGLVSWTKTKLERPVSPTELYAPSLLFK